MPPKRPPFWVRLRAALQGLWAAYREEPNLRFQVFAGTTAAVVGWAARLSGWEVAYLALTIVLVLTAEMVNTAVERAVDLACGNQFTPLAGKAKDVAAGAVLLAAFHALWAGIWLFAVQRPLAVTLRLLAQQVAASPWAAVPVILAGFGWLGLSRGRQVPE